MMKSEISHCGIFTGGRWILSAFLFSLLFIIVSLLIVSAGYSLIWIVPPALVLFLAAIISVEKLLLFTVFCAPLSLQLRFIMPEVTADLFLPTEPILAAIMIIMLFKTFATRETDKRILSHPVTIITGSMLIWLLITSLTGTMPLVSLKYLVARLWFIAGFYLLASQMFLKEGMIKKFFSAYLAGMTPVAVYYLIRLSQYGVLNQVTAYSAIRPFFNDHTALGASLAFCIPLSLYLFSNRGNSFPMKLFRFLQLMLFFTAFVFSYSRAAWLSLSVSAVVTLILILKVSWKIIIPALTILVIIIITTWSSMLIRLNENRQDSSLNLEKQLRSIANIRTDASNLERINRWKSALRMSAERPLFGWGPGTYQFTYAPFQMASEKTQISTNWGEGGNAHSDYLGLLAEAGIPGMIIYLALIFVILKKGISLYKKSRERETRIMLLCMIAGLVTYLVHGTLNNFLDTDKISALFWGMIAAVVATGMSSTELSEAEGQ
ncbi:MAG: O-antigen ligase family protein [Bacteroidales bacterium]|jgi:O-antigen ligase